MTQMMTKNKKVIVTVILLISLIFFVFLKVFQNNPSEIERSTMEAFPEELRVENQTTDDIPESEAINNEMIYVDIKGAVLKPNVYKVEDGSRVQDAIVVAGGFLDRADKLRINLAARVQDEMVIYVPEIGEQVESELNLFASQEKDGRVNINTASIEQLQDLPGIGASKAASIISYRDQNGSFKKIEDVVNVSGIGEKSFEKLKDQITVR